MMSLEKVLRNILTGQHIHSYM